MKRTLLRRMGIVIAILVILGCAAVIGVRHLLQGPFLHDQLVRAVERATGRELTINGGIVPTWSLTPTVEINDFALANASWAGDAPMAKGEKLSVTVALRPLLNKQIVIKSVALEKASLNLLQKGDKANWQLTPAASVENTAEAKQQPAETASSTPAFTLDELNLKDITVTYQQDGQPAKTLRLENGRVALPSGLNGKLALEGKGSLDETPVTVQAEIADLKVLEAGTSDAKIDLNITGAVSLAASGKVSRDNDAWALDQDITLKIQNSEQYQKLAGAPLPVGMVEVTTRIKGSTSALTLKPLRIEADGSAITGEAAVSARKGGGWAVNTTLAAGTITLPANKSAAAAAPAGDKGGAPAPAGGDTRVIPDTPVTFSLPDNLTVNAKFTADAITSGETELKHVALTTLINGGVIAFKPLTAGVEGGNIELNGTIRPGVKSTAITFNLGTQGYVLGDFLKRRKISDALSEGPVQFSLNASGAGATVRDLAESLDGKASLAMDRGVYRVSYDSGAAQFFQLLSGGKEGKNITINCAVADFAIVGGVMRTDSIAADATGATVRGNGTVDLGTERLNLLLNPKAKDVALASLAFPLRITGSLANPVFAPDKQMAAATAVRAAAGLAGLGAGKVAGVTAGDTVGTGVARCREILKEPQVQAEKPADVIRDTVGGAVQQLIEKKQKKQQPPAGTEAATGEAPAKRPSLEDQLKQVLPF